MSTKNTSPDSSAETIGLQGYTSKPLWIYAISAVFILSPFVNFAFSLKGRGEPGWLSPAVWLEWLPHTPPRSFAVSTLLFMTGVLLLYVNRWSWHLATVALIVLCGYNLLLIRGIVVNNFYILATVCAMMGGFLFLLYQSEFRDVFINPRLRWRESKPRFAVDREIGIKGTRARFTLVDISKSGFFISSKSKAFVPALEQVISVEIAEGVSIPGTIVRIEPTSTGFSIGVRIDKIAKHESRYLYNWLRILKKSSKKIR